MSNIRTELKLIVVGTAGTGKTSLVNKYTRNTFNENYRATVVSEFGFKVFPYEGINYRVQIWDLAGQDKNATVTKIFAKDAHGVLVVADATKRVTLEETKTWKDSVDESTSFPDEGKLPCVLVENKKDLLTEEELKDGEEYLKEFATKNEFDNYFVTSAKTGENVEAAISFLIKNIIERFKNMKEEDYELSRQRNNVTLVSDNHSNKTETRERDKKQNCC